MLLPSICHLTLLNLIIGEWDKTCDISLVDAWKKFLCIVRSLTYLWLRFSIPLWYFITFNTCHVLIGDVPLYMWRILKAMEHVIKYELKILNRNQNFKLMWLYPPSKAKTHPHPEIFHQDESNRALDQILTLLWQSHTWGESHLWFHFLFK